MHNIMCVRVCVYIYIQMQIAFKFIHARAHPQIRNDCESKFSCQWTSLGSTLNFNSQLMGPSKRDAGCLLQIITSLSGISRKCLSYSPVAFLHIFPYQKPTCQWILTDMLTSLQQTCKHLVQVFPFPISEGGNPAQINPQLM